MNRDEEDEDSACRLEAECWDILAAAKHEPILLHLFTQIPTGRWMQLNDLLPGGLNEEIFVTWLYLPSKTDADFRLVLFLHEESAWSMTATYNVERLLRNRLGAGQENT